MESEPPVSAPVPSGTTLNPVATAQAQRADAAVAALPCLLARNHAMNFLARRNAHRLVVEQHDIAGQVRGLDRLSFLIFAFGSVLAQHIRLANLTMMYLLSSS